MTTNNKTQTVDNLSAALTYAERGWAVFPIHTIDGDGNCSCREIDCQSPGKHPRTSAGFKDATTNLEQIRDWWSRWPEANVGIRTGGGLAVLDIDPRNGGNDALAEFEREFGELPRTYTVTTGGGGKHFYYSVPADLDLKCKNSFRPGLDLKAHGGYVVAPPSQHKSGSRYVVDNPEVPIAVIPDSLTSVRAERNRSNLTLISADFIPEGQRHDTLFRLGCSMRGKGFSDVAIQAALAEQNNLCSPEPLSKKELEGIVESCSKYNPGIYPSVDLYCTSGISPPSRDIAKDAFYGLAGDFVGMVEPHTESDPIALLAQFLLAFGNILGRGPHQRLDDSRHGTNLFIGLFGSTARARKGTALNRVLSAFRLTSSKWFDECRGSGLISGEGFIWRLRDTVTKVVESKDEDLPHTTETILVEGTYDKRLLITETEFASVLRVLEWDGSTLSARLRDAWDGNTLRNMSKSSSATVTDPHVSIIAHITTPELKRYLSKTEAANGFGNRFLWFFVQRSKSLPEGGAIPESELTQFCIRLNEAIEFGSNDILLVKDEDATQLWAEVYETLEPEKDGLFEAVTARGPAQVMRLAAVYALLDCSAVIREIHLKAALALWNYSVASCATIWGGSVGFPDADKIRQSLTREPTGLTSTEIIHKVFQKNKSAADIQAALIFLKERGLVFSVEESGNSGPKTTRWHSTERLPKGRKTDKKESGHE